MLIKIVMMMTMMIIVILIILMLDLTLGEAKYKQAL